MTLLARASRLIGVLAAPSRRRAITVALATFASVALVWSYFLVPADVLTESARARRFVEWATLPFPWLKNLEKFGQLGEKALFLHSVFMIACFLPTVIHTVSQLDPQFYTKSKQRSALRNVFLGAFLIYLVAIMPFSVLSPERPSLAENIFLLSPIGIPIYAIALGYGFWVLVTHSCFALLNLGNRKEEARS